MDAIVLDFGTGGDAVEGECLLEGEDKKILCLGYNHSVAMPMNWDVSNMKRTVGKPNFSDFTITKKCDLATPKLHYYCAVAKRFAEVGIRLYQADGEDDFKLFMEYKLSDTIVSNVTVSGGQGDIPIETLSLNYSKIKWVYKKQKIDVAQEGQSAYEYDLTKSKGAAAS